jgi:hypothetical protein
MALWRIIVFCMSGHSLKFGAKLIKLKFNKYRPSQEISILNNWGTCDTISYLKIKNILMSQYTIEIMLYLSLKYSGTFETINQWPIFLVTIKIIIIIYLYFFKIHWHCVTMALGGKKIYKILNTKIHEIQIPYDISSLWHMVLMNIIP